MRRPPDSKRAIMRIGNNPMRGKPIQHTMPGEVATVTTHLPNQEGYHAQRLEVVQTCLKSMRNGASGIPVMVWDKPKLPKLHPPYDLVLVDGEPVEERAYYIRAAEKLVKPGGVFVLDKFNRPEYQAEREALEKRHRHLEFRFSFGLYLNTQFFFIGQKP